MASKKEKEPEKRKPDFVVRCKQSPDSDFWQTIGAAWSADINGKTGYSVRLHLIPTNWDGSFSAHASSRGQVSGGGLSRGGKPLLFEQPKNCSEATAIAA